MSSSEAASGPRPKPAPTSRTGGGPIAPGRSGAVEPTSDTVATVSNDTCVIAIDAGTTGVRSRAVFGDARPAVAAYREFTQHFPQPGWVEHDAQEIWAAVVATLTEVIEQVGRDTVAAIGITNQRETVLAWSRSTGEPHGTAIVWQDRRTAARCDQLAADGHLELVRQNDRVGARPVLQRHQGRVAASRTATSRSTTIWRSARSTPG